MVRVKSLSSGTLKFEPVGILVNREAFRAEITKTRAEIDTLRSAERPAGWIVGRKGRSQGRGAARQR
jgi:hypothetical protein